jgi:ribosomal protein S18 acetylase RimI-like enzyme
MASASEIDPQPVGTFWMLNLEGPLPDAPTPRLVATFGLVDAEVVPALSRAMGLDAPALALERFAAGKRCYGAWFDGTLAAYGWVTFDEERIGELGLRVRLGSGEAYIWDCATLPAYRGQRLYPALLAHITRTLRAEGFRQVLIGAETDNLASQQGFRLAGFQPVADMLHLPGSASGQMVLRGRVGAPEHLVQHIRQALLNDESRLL